MLRLKSSLALTLLAVCAIACAADFASPADFASSAPQQFYLRNGDKVVFYGDSITDQRLYTMFTELYTVTRFPQMDVRFVHSGWGGDRVTGGGGGPVDLRLQRDVVAYKPTVMTIMLGMNDGHYVEHKSSDDPIFQRGFQHIVETIRHDLPDVRITAIEPSPFDDVTRPLTLQPSGYNAVLVNYSHWIASYAAQAKLNVADLNTGVVNMLQKANTSDPAIAQKILPDRVHPAPAGHLIMAEQLLKAWNARSLVSAVTIDAKKGRATASQYATISDVQATGPLTWTELDQSLPLPFFAMLAADRDHTLDLALRSSDVTDALNQQELRVTNLRPGKYRLNIDGTAAGSWSDSDLAQGVNLATLDTPMAKQAWTVHEWTVRHMDIHQFRWRTLQVPLQDANLRNQQDAIKTLDLLEEDVIHRQREAAQPRPRLFQLVAIE